MFFLLLHYVVFILVGNIPYEATEEQLKDIFSEVGLVVSFRWVEERNCRYHSFYELTLANVFFVAVTSNLVKSKIISYVKMFKQRVLHVLYELQCVFSLYIANRYRYFLAFLIVDGCNFRLDYITTLLVFCSHGCLPKSHRSKRCTD